MTKEKILEGNEIIAKFMGAVELNESSGLLDPSLCLEMINPSNNDDLRYVSITALKYHSSWDWLIPVIDKITSMDEYFKYKDYTSNIVSEGGIYINTRFIENTCIEVVDFINYYNKNK